MASRSPLGRPLEGFLERLGGFLVRLGAILGVLGRCFGDSRPSWAVLVASWCSLGPSWGRLGPQKVTRQAAGSPRGDARSPRRDAGSPGKIGTRGSEPFKSSSGVRTEAQGRVRGPENTPTPCLAARWRILRWIMASGGANLTYFYVSQDTPEILRTLPGDAGQGGFRLPPSRGQ